MSKTCAVTHNLQAMTLNGQVCCGICKKMLTSRENQGLQCTECSVVVHPEMCKEAALTNLPCRRVESVEYFKSNTLADCASDGALLTRKSKSSIWSLSTEKSKSSNGALPTEKSRSSDAALSTETSDDSDEISISGPRNVRHAAGMNPNMRTISLDEARQDSRNKIEPTPRPLSVRHNDLQLNPEFYADTRTTQPAPSRPAKPQGLSKRLIPSRPVRNFFKHQTAVMAAAAENAKRKTAAENIPSNVIQPSNPALPNTRFSKMLEANLCIDDHSGVPLAGYCDTVPEFLVLLGKELHRRNGFSEMGIFRVSASRNAVVNLRLELPKSKNLEEFEAHIQAADTHTIAALIKEWYRSLSESLMHGLDEPLGELLTFENLERTPPSELFRKVLENFLHGNHFLPLRTRASFLWILDIMNMVVANSDSNKMGFVAIATCFAPTLYVPIDRNATPQDSIKLTRLATNVIVNALIFIDSYDILKKERDTFGKCG